MQLLAEPLRSCAQLDDQGGLVARGETDGEAAPPRPPNAHQLLVTAVVPQLDLLARPGCWAGRRHGQTRSPSGAGWTWQGGQEGGAGGGGRGRLVGVGQQGGV